MEPLDTDLEYSAYEHHAADPRARFNWLLLIPLLGVLWLVYLIAAAIFQWPITGVVNPVMTLMLVVFFVMSGLLFWSLAPKANRE